MEITIISTFDVDISKVLEQSSPPPPGLTLEEQEQCVKDTFLRLFESSIKMGFEDNDFIRLVYAILDESEDKR